jgi:hypothetical protein
LLAVVAVGFALIAEAGNATSLDVHSRTTAQNKVDTPNLLVAPRADLHFYSDNIVVGGIAKLVLVLVNSNNAAITGIQFQENVPGAIAISSDGTVNSCGGTLVADPDGSSIALSGGTIEANLSCSIEVNLIGGAPGSWFIHTGPISSTNAAPGADVGATLGITDDALLAAPTVTTAFTPGTVVVGGYSLLNIQLSNSDPLRAIVGAQLSDAFPAGFVSAPNSVVVSNDCSPNVYPDDHGLEIYNATVPPAGSCQVVVKIVGAFTGTWTNPTGSVVSSNASLAQGANASLTVVGGALLPAPSVALSFSPASVLVGDATELKVTLTNGSSTPIHDIQNFEYYPAGITNASNAVVVENTCGGVLNAAPNGNSLSLSGATIPGLGSCDVEVTVTGLWANAYTSSTGIFYSANANPAGPGIATLNVTGDASLLGAPNAVETFTPSTVAIGDISEMKIALSNQNAVAITGAAITDVYPEHLINASANVIAGNSCGGTVTALPNGNSIQLAGATIPVSGCSVVINVTPTLAYVLVNHIGPVTSSNANTGADASAALYATYNAGAQLSAPTVSETFQPATVPVGVTSQATVTLTNSNASAITDVQFSDVYPQGMATAPSGVISNSCGGTIAADIGGSSLTLSGGVIPANAPCSVVVGVQGAAAGSYDNHTGIVTSANADFSADAVATLTVTPGALIAAPLVSKSFAPDHVVAGDMVGTSVMTIALTNNDQTTAITGAKFTDNYPLPLHIANAPSNVVQANTCGGTLTAAANETSVTLIGGVVPSNDTCYVKIQVVGLSAGTVDNHTGPVDSDNASTGADAVGTLTVTPATLQSQTITFTSTPPPDAVVLGPNYVAIATATSGLPVALTIDAASANVCVIANDIVSFIGPGSCTIDANQAGNVDYASAPQTQQTFAVATAGGAGSQMISFTSTPPVGAIVNGPTYTPTAVATSMLPVVLTIDGASAAVCKISSGTVNFIGAGICWIDANQGGDADFAPAPQVQQTVVVAGAGGSQSQTIAFTSTVPALAVVNGPGYVATAVATSMLPVALAVDGTSATVCSYNNGAVSFIGPGMCTVDANQGGDASFAPAPQTQQAFAVASAGGTTSQSITFTSTAPADAVVGGSTYLVTATADSNLQVVLTIDGTSATVCAINNGTVTFIGPGVCTIDANQGGDAEYAPAPQSQQAFMVAHAGGSASQTISFTSTAPVSAIVGGPGYLATATASSDLPVVLTIDAASAIVCTINNETVNFIGSGSCTIDANQGGDADFAPAAQAQQTFPVAGADGVTSQAITFISAAPANATVGGPSYLAIATATSNLPVVLTIDAISAAECSINNGTVSFTGEGTCTIDANQGGDADFAPASQMQQMVNVGLAAGDLIFRDGFDNP